MKQNLTAVGLQPGLLSAHPRWQWRSRRSENEGYPDLLIWLSRSQTLVPAHRGIEIRMLIWPNVWTKILHYYSRAKLLLCSTNYKIKNKLGVFHCKTQTNSCIKLVSSVWFPCKHMHQMEVLYVCYLGSTAKKNMGENHAEQKLCDIFCLVCSTCKCVHTPYMMTSWKWEGRKMQGWGMEARIAKQAGQREIVGRGEIQHRQRTRASEAG